MFKCPTCGKVGIDGIDIQEEYVGFRYWSAFLDRKTVVRLNRKDDEIPALTGVLLRCLECGNVVPVPDGMEIE